MKQGVARLTIDEKELYNMAVSRIRRAQDELALLMEKGIIPPYEE